MPNKKLTDSEIVKALEYCLKDGYEKCKKCQYYGTVMCTTELLSNALDLINRLQAENERLDKEVDRLSQCVLYKNAELGEYEKIKTTIDEFWEILSTLSLCKRKEKPTLEEFAEAIQEIKAEAYKEFSERVKKLPYYPSYTNLHKAVDNLLKELEEK